MWETLDLSLALQSIQPGCFVPFEESKGLHPQMLNLVLKLLQFINSDFCFKPASWFQKKDLACKHPYPYCVSTGPKPMVNKSESYEIKIKLSNIFIRFRNT